MRYPRDKGVYIEENYRWVDVDSVRVQNLGIVERGKDRLWQICREGSLVGAEINSLSVCNRC